MTSISKRLAGRLALITGASRGIGAAVAKRFAAEGAQVILVARTVGALEELDDEIRAAGSAATLLPLDLRDFDKIDQMGAALYERFGRLDVLVGNAGVLGSLSPRCCACRRRAAPSSPPAPRRATPSLIGAPVPPARRRSRRWCGSMPAKSPRRI